jgi:DHA1 family tetracycline resistance protein-like MFS transporter
LTMQNKNLTTVFVIVFIDLLGFSLILPLLPYYAETFGATPTVVGLLVASYAAAQLLGAPLLGRLSDRYGRRPVLLLSIFGTFLGFLLLGFARSLWVLFASRILDGLTGGNISVAQAYITDVTDEKSRARGLGLIGAAFGLGFIIGPAVGGALSINGYALPAFAAAGLAFMNLIAVFTWLPESLTEVRRAELAQRPRPAFTFRALWQALNRPRVGPLLHVRFFFGLAFAIFQTIFALYAQYRLGLEANQTGYVLAYVGLLSVLVQGVAIGWLTTRVSERYLIFSAVVLMAFSLLAWAFVPSLLALLVLLAPLALAGGTLNTILSSALTKSVYPEEVGGTLGLSTSLESLTRVVAPSVGGVLLGRLGSAAPGVFGALIMLWVVSFVWRRLIVNPDPPLPDRESLVPAGAPLEAV